MNLRYFLERAGGFSGCALVACMVLGAFSGCATSIPKWDEVPLPPSAEAVALAETQGVDPATVVPETRVVLQPYDAIQVKFLYWPELDAEQVIRPDGKISLLMIGEVEAQNRTPEELRQELLALYQDKLNDPEINVVVSSLANDRVYVGGMVGAPGLIPIEGRLTALAAVMQAGGFLADSAKMKEVVLLRQQDGKQYARTIDLKSALKNPESDNFLLQPYDIVYVPSKAIANVNQFVNQYIDGVLPKGLTSTATSVWTITNQQKYYDDLTSLSQAASSFSSSR